MSHYVVNPPEKKGAKRFSFPKINGRVGFSLYVGMKEFFFGVTISDVITEQIIRKRFLKVAKGEARTYGFDPFSGDTEASST